MTKLNSSESDGKDKSIKLGVPKSVGINTLYNSLIDNIIFLFFAFVICILIYCIFDALLYLSLPLKIASIMDEILFLVFMIGYAGFLLFLFRNGKEGAKYYKIIKWIVDPFRFTDDLDNYRLIDCYPVSTWEGIKYSLMTIWPMVLLTILSKINEPFGLPFGGLIMFVNLYYMFKWRRNVRYVGNDYKHWLKKLEKSHFTDYNVSQRPAFYCIETSETLKLFIRFPNRTSELVKKEFVCDFEEYTGFKIVYLEINPRKTYVTLNKVAG